MHTSFESAMRIFGLGLVAHLLQPVFANGGGASAQVDLICSQLRAFDHMAQPAQKFGVAHVEFGVLLLAHDDHAAAAAFHLDIHVEAPAAGLDATHLGRNGFVRAGGHPLRQWRFTEIDDAFDMKITQRGGGLVEQGKRRPVDMPDHAGGVHRDNCDLFFAEHSVKPWVRKG